MVLELIEISFRSVQFPHQLSYLSNNLKIFLWTGDDSADRVLAAEHDDLSSVPGTYMVESANWLLKVVL